MKRVIMMLLCLIALTTRGQDEIKIPRMQTFTAVVHYSSLSKGECVSRKLKWVSNPQNNVFVHGDIKLDSINICIDYEASIITINTNPIRVIHLTNFRDAHWGPENSCQANTIYEWWDVLLEGRENVIYIARSQDSDNMRISILDDPKYNAQHHYSTKIPTDYDF